MSFVFSKGQKKIFFRSCIAESDWNLKQEHGRKMYGWIEAKVLLGEEGKKNHNESKFCVTKADVHHPVSSVYRRPNTPHKLMCSRLPFPPWIPSLIPFDFIPAVPFFHSHLSLLLLPAFLPWRSLLWCASPSIFATLCTPPAYSSRVLFTWHAPYSIIYNKLFFFLSLCLFISFYGCSVCWIFFFLWEPTP